MLIDTRIDVADADMAELEDLLAAHGAPRFHARQLYQWIHRRGITDFELMLDAYVSNEAQPRSQSDRPAAIATFQLHVRATAFPGRSYRREPARTGAAVEMGFIVVGEDSKGATRRLTCAGSAIAERAQNLDSDCKAAMIFVLEHGLPAELFGQ